MRIPKFILGAASIALLLGGIGPASAALTVGPGCEYPSLQGAIDAANGTFEIHVLAGYTSPPVSFSNKAITLIGGFPSCDAEEPTPFDGSNHDTLSNIDGSLSEGHAGIDVSGSAALSLGYFNIHNATHDGANGGGIAFNGSGDHAYLELNHVRVNNNSAERGAGVFFRGTATASNEMHIDDFSYIQGNEASLSGGGIRLEGQVKLVAAAANALISDNSAGPDSDDGAGGGIQLRDNTRAYMGSPWGGNRFFIDNNHARLGGGVAVQNSASLYLYPSQPGALSTVGNNDAVVAGGGVYVDPDTGPITFCMAGAAVVHNRAATGGAIFLRQESEAANFYAATFGLQCGGVELPNFVPCSVGGICNAISQNQATDATGIVVYQQNTNGDLSLSNIEVRGNTGGGLLWTASRRTQRIGAVEFAANSIGSVAFSNTGGELDILGSTFGDNTFGQSSSVVFSGDGPLNLSNSIFWAPGQATFGRPTNTIALANMITSDADRLHPGEFVTFDNVRGNDPKFLDEAGGDLRLRDDSPAIDAAATGVGVDILQHSRGVDVAQGPGSPNLGPYDLGAYEMQVLDQGIPATFPPDEDFEERASTGTLPLNWQVEASRTDAAWILTDSFPDSGTRSAYAPDLTSRSASSLTTVAIPVVHHGLLTFRHRVALEHGQNSVALDAAILEIAIGDDAFFYEIESVGGEFVEGGYDHVVSSHYDNPMAGLRAWSGDFADYRDVKVYLPANADGKNVRLRWQIATDTGGSGAGYWLDSIHFEPDGDAATDYIFADGFGDEMQRRAVRDKSAVRRGDP